MRRFVAIGFVVGLAWAGPVEGQTPQTPPATTAAPKPQPPATTPGTTPAPTTPSQPPAPAAGAAQTTSVPAARRFTGDVGAMFSLIKPDKTADFDAVMLRVKEALGKSQDPKRKAQAEGWTVYKAAEPGPGGAVLYVWLFNPAIKDADYTISAILAEAFPNEVQDLWAKYTQCFVSGQTMINLTLTTNMSPTAPVVPK